MPAGRRSRTSSAACGPGCSPASPQRGLTLPTLAVAWTLSHLAVDVALVGARRATQLDETVTAGAVLLSQQDREELGQIISEAAPVTGPSPEGM